MQLKLHLIIYKHETNCQLSNFYIVYEGVDRILFSILIPFISKLFKIKKKEQQQMTELNKIISNQMLWILNCFLKLDLDFAVF